MFLPDPNAPKSDDFDKKNFRISFLSFLVSVLSLVVTILIGLITYHLSTEANTIAEKASENTDAVNSLNKILGTLNQGIDNQKSELESLNEQLKINSSMLSINNRKDKIQIYKDANHLLITTMKLFSTLPDITFELDSQLHVTGVVNNFDIEKASTLVDTAYSLYQSESSNSFLLSNDTLTKRWFDITRNLARIRPFFETYKTDQSDSSTNYFYMQAGPLSKKEFLKLQEKEIEKQFEEIENENRKICFDCLDILKSFLKFTSSKSKTHN